MLRTRQGLALDLEHCHPVGDALLGFGHDFENRAPQRRQGAPLRLIQPREVAVDLSLRHRPQSPHHATARPGPLAARHPPDKGTRAEGASPPSGLVRERSWSRQVVWSSTPPSRTAGRSEAVSISLSASATACAAAARTEVGAASCAGVRARNAYLGVMPNVRPGAPLRERRGVPRTVIGEVLPDGWGRGLVATA